MCRFPFWRKIMLGQHMFINFIMLYVYFYLREYTHHAVVCWCWHRFNYSREIMCVSVYFENLCLWTLVTIWDKQSPNPLDSVHVLPFRYSYQSKLTVMLQCTRYCFFIYTYIYICICFTYLTHHALSEQTFTLKNLLISLSCLFVNGDKLLIAQSRYI